MDKEFSRYQGFLERLSNLIVKPKSEITYREYRSLAAYCFEVACYEYRYNKNIEKFIALNASAPKYILTSYKYALLSDDNNDLSRGPWSDYYSPRTYVNIYSGLSGKNFVESRELAKLIIENSFFESIGDYNDAYYYGYCLLYLLANGSKFWPIYNKLKKKKNKKTVPYVKIYEGIVEDSESLAQEGIDELVLVMNKNWEDEHTGFINTWALGLANLCRLHGVMVHESMQKVPKMLIPANEVKPQVPEELLVTPEEVEATLKQYPSLGTLPPQ